MKASNEIYQRLPQSDGQEDGYGNAWRSINLTGASNRVLHLICLVLLLPSLALNAFTIWKHVNQPQGPIPGFKSFSGLPYDTPIVYQSVSEWFGGDNDTLEEELWYNLESNAATVALSDDWAAEHGLSESIDFPWDHDKGLYTVKAFHHMHCLKHLRKGLQELSQMGQTSMEVPHLMHCLDALRQDLMCIADDTLMSTIQAPHRIGNGQIRQCRNWEDLTAWAKAPERDACFSLIDEYKLTKHPIENFAFCSENSPYFDVMAAYFEIHGHDEPFAD